MKFSDLSLKGKFDAAVISVFGEPSKILSDEYHKDGQNAYLIFKKNKDFAGYSGQLIYENESKKGFMGVGIPRVAETLDYGPQIVSAEAIPEIIDTWQKHMEEAEWSKNSMTRFGYGAEYQAVAYKKDLRL